MAEGGIPIRRSGVPSWRAVPAESATLTHRATAGEMGRADAQGTRTHPAIEDRRLSGRLRRNSGRVLSSPGDGRLRPHPPPESRPTELLAEPVCERARISTERHQRRCARRFLGLQSDPPQEWRTLGRSFTFVILLAGLVLWLPRWAAADSVELASGEIISAWCGASPTKR